MKLFALIATIALTSTIAQANIVLTVLAGNLTKADGVTPLDKGSTVAFVVDADQDGFGDQTQATDSFVAEEGDVLLGVYPTNNQAGTGGAGIAVSIDFNLDSQITTGDPFRMVFYDLPYSEGMTGPGAGVNFNTYRTDTPGASFSDAEAKWVIPGDSAAVGLNMITEDLGGAATAAEASTTQTTVPEPASMLIALAGGALITRRRMVG